jgi:hypothetical protein
MRSARKAGMARPKLEIRRDRQFNVGLTADEHADLHRRARAAGMRPVDYARSRLFSKHFPTLPKVTRPPHLDPLLLTHISRIGNNLNQIARQLNSRPLPMPPSLEPLLQELRALLRREAGS